MKNREDADLFSFIREYNHNLRNPMNTIIGTLELFTMGNYGELTPKQERAIKRVQRNTHRLLALIIDATHYTRVQQGTYPTETAALSIETIAASALNSLTALLDSEGITVDRSLTVDDVKSHVEVIERGIHHLLCNAAAHTPPNMAIQLSAIRHDSQMLHITVSNPISTPIPEDDQVRLQEVFWAGVKPFRREIPTSGYGMGLAVADQISRAVGGSLSLNITDTQFTAVLAVPIANNP